MAVLRVESEKTYCRTCGEDITEHARYQRWTECSLCYWQRRLQESPSLEPLIKRRNELRMEDKQVNAQVELATIEKRARENLLRATAPWWKKVLGLELSDKGLDELGLKVSAIHSHANRISRDLEQVESSIETVKHVRKQFDSAAQHAAITRKREQDALQRKLRFDEDSGKASFDSYDRSLFNVRKQDYKRGNPLDNHFRSRLLAQVTHVFDGECLYCKGTHNLTLDHFGIPKNEGGNFVMLLQDGNGIRMNIVLLCRSCNASKGERMYDAFFDEAKVNEAIIRQKRLLEIVLADDETMAVVRAWYGIRSGKTLGYFDVRQSR